jgi:4-diphosphocytidyl-2-C-methyl-D-erythritol kinase
MEETGYAKLNLALHVRTREPDGYHRLETLFAFCEDGDRLSVAPGEGLELRITGPFGAELVSDGNLVLRAAEALRNACGIRHGASLTLDKRLPVASGIGGGSADAAAALRLLTRWWKVETGAAELHAIAAGLGADVPACIESGTVRGEGRGDELVPVPSDLGGTPVLLVNPLVPLSTPAVFRAWDRVDRGPLRTGDTRAAAREGRNDLEAPAIALVPEVTELLDLLARQRGVVLARMSGSGATCFALFDRQADRDRAAALIGKERPGWWQLPSRLR